MGSWRVCVLAGSLALSGLGGAQAFEAGSVHQEHCTACHARVTGGDGHVLYRGTKGIIGDAEQLQARVDHCRKGAGLDWGEDQVKAMRDYLNGRFYGLGVGE